MPEISRFLGIVIAMYYREHGPALFHAIYGDFEVTVEIESGRINGPCSCPRPAAWSATACRRSELANLAAFQKRVAARPAVKAAMKAEGLLE